MILIKVFWLNYFHVRACGYFTLFFFTILFTLSPKIPTKPKLSIMRAMSHNLVGKGSKPVHRMPLQCVKTEVKSGAVFESVTVFCTKEALCWRSLRIDVLWEGLSKLVISPECEVWKCSSIPTDKDIVHSLSYHAEARRLSQRALPAFILISNHTVMTVDWRRKKIILLKFHCTFLN